ncbi:ice-binding family protein [Flavobacterium ovatum]|uniref:ice-binding family protein n=1 Tax=Flavobacterium ovatum TaxID=1928857 RepID=UPI00344EA50E
MNKKLILLLTIHFLILHTSVTFAKYINPTPPPVGTTNNFVLFTAAGDISNAGTTSTYYGNVGTNAGTLTGFASLIIQPTNLYATTPETAQCTDDLKLLYSDLVNRTGTERSGAYGSETLTPGVYTTAGAASIAGILTLNGGGDPNARFIIKTGGAFTMGAEAKIFLTNGTQAKNVFWVIADACAIAANCEARGLFICYSGAISLGASCTLEGGALTIAGAITTLDEMSLATAATNTMVLSESQSIVSGTVPADLVLTGNISPVIKWQSSTDPNFTEFTDILHFSARLSGSCIGPVTTTTFYRAVILIDGIPAYSNRIKITTTVPLNTGPLAPFALFTTAGAVTNGATTSTNNGLIGTNSGALTGTFSNIPSLHAEDALTLTCANYLLPLFNSIKNTHTTDIHAVSFGAGEILLPGVYEIGSAATMSGILTLDSQNNPNSIFIIKITGALALAAGTEIKLINKASSANVFWVMDGALGVGASCTVRGTFICLAGAIALGDNCITEGGMFTIAGAITLDNSTLSTPPTNTMHLSADQTIATGALLADLVLTGNTSPVIKWQWAINNDFSNPTDILLSSTILSGSCVGPLITTTFYRAVILIDGVNAYSNSIKITTSVTAPNLDPLFPFTLFTKDGAITNAAGISTNNGLIGTNSGAISGIFSNMSSLHKEDALTQTCANYLLPLFNSIKNTPTTNTHGAAFVDGESLEPGVHHIASAATLGGALTLNGLGSTNSIFIIKITGALSIAASSQIELTNGALASNVFWVIDGALNVGASCKIRGTFICLAGAITLGNLTITDGGIFTIAGAITLQNCTLSTPIIASSNQVVVSGLQPQNLTLTGHMDTVLRWEKSTDSFFTTPIAIANTTTTLTGSQIGILPRTTYFRAVAIIGSNTIHSNSVIIAIHQATNSVTPGASSSMPTLYINTVLTNITHSTNAATGIRNATGLPPGVTAIWASNTITISGSPTASGIFNYSIPLTGGCGNDARGTITVNPKLVVLTGGLISSNQAFCSTSVPADLSLSGNTGWVVKWQSSLTPDFAIAADITSNDTTLNGTTIGYLSLTTYFRAVVQSCTEPVQYAIPVKISIASLTTWNGSSWDNGFPSATKSVIFTGNLTASEDIHACSITVNNGAVVIVNSNYTMTITNELTVSDGSLTFENNASLVQINDGAINSGNITYKRQSASVRPSDYTYWSSPVAGQTLARAFSNSPSNRIYSFNAFSTTQNWKKELTSTIMSIGTGYIVQGPQANSSTTTSIYETSFLGKPNNGIIEIPIGPEGTSNLIGNPYPSAIDADTFLNVNSSILEGTIYFWTHATAIQLASQISNPGSGTYAYTSDDYASYNLTGGAGVAAVSDGIMTIPSGKIAAGQAFFSTSKTSNANVQFNNNMRLAGGTSGSNNSQFFKINTTSKTKLSKVIKKDRIWLNLTNSQGAFKQTLVGYITGATNEYNDSYDGESFDGNKYVDFYSIKSNKNLVIQGKTWPFDINDEVPLGFKTTINGDLKISIDHLDGSLLNQSIFIKDNLNSTIFNLKNGNYIFTTAAGTFNDRFVLLYTNKNLGTKDFSTQQDTVLVSSKNKQINIISTVETIDKVLIYDVSGREIYQKNNINDTELLIPDLASSHQPIFVKTVLQNEKVVNTKVLY